MANFRQLPVEQVKADLAASRLKEKPTSEQLRLEAERLRATAAELKKHAATLLEKSAQLERQISRLRRDIPSQNRKP
jgi:hypothetical protein